MEGRALIINLVANTRKAEGDLNQFSNRVKGYGFAWTAALATAGAAVGAFALKLGVDGVKAAIEEEAAVAKLAKTLSNLGLGDATNQVESFVDTLARSTGVADDQLRPAFDRLVRSTRDVGKAQDLLALSLDVAAGTGKDLATVVEAIGKAASGSTTGLARLGAGIDAATLRSGDFEAITAKLSETFSGQAATSAKTLEGQFARLKVGADELIEAFGTGLISAIGDTTTETDALTQGMKDLEPAVGFLGKRLGETTGDLGSIVSGLANVTGATASTTSEMNAFQKSIDYLVNDFPFLWNGLKTVSNVVGWLGGETAQVRPSIRALDRALEQAGGAAIDAKGKISDLTAELGDAARQNFLTAGSYVDLYTAIANKERVARDYANTSATVSGAILEGARKGSSPTVLAQTTRAYEQVARAARSAGGSASSAGDTMSKANIKAEKSAQALADRVDLMARRLESVKKQAADAKAAFDDFAAKVSSAVGALNLGDAIDTAVKDAADRADLDKKIADAIAKGDGEGQAKLEAQKAGMGAAVSWVDAFRVQIEQSNAASKAMQDLKTHLVDEAGKPIPGADLLVGQLLTLDPAQIKATVDDLISKNLIPEFTSKLAESKDLADGAGAAFATPFYGAGLSAADQALAALQARAVERKADFEAVGALIGKDIADQIRAQIAAVLSDSKKARNGLSVTSAGAVAANGVAPIININAPLADPVALGRQIQRVLRTTSTRTGVL